MGWALRKSQQSSNENSMKKQSEFMSVKSLLHICIFNILNNQNPKIMGSQILLSVEIFSQIWCGHTWFLSFAIWTMSLSFFSSRSGLSKPQTITNSWSSSPFGVTVKLIIVTLMKTSQAKISTRGFRPISSPQACNADSEASSRCKTWTRWSTARLDHRAGSASARLF